MAAPSIELTIENKDPQMAIDALRSCIYQLELGTLEWVSGAILLRHQANGHLAIESNVVLGLKGADDDTARSS